VDTPWEDNKLPMNFNATTNKGGNDKMASLDMMAV
jgi:hypothetical protein